MALDPSISRAITYRQWLDEQKTPHCDDLTQQMITAAAGDENLQAENEIDDILATLFPLKKLNDFEVRGGVDGFDARMKTMFDNLVPAHPRVFSPDVVLPFVPSVCPQATQDAASALTDYITLLNDSLTYLDWLTMEAESCCEDIRQSIIAITGTKSRMLADQRIENSDFISKIIEIRLPTPTEADISADFDRAVGLLPDAHSMWNVPVVPDGCPADAHIAYNVVAAICIELDTSLNFGSWLENEVKNACDEQQLRINDLIEDNMPRLNAGEAEKLQNFETWFMLEGQGFADVTEFMNDMETNFMQLYNDELADPSLNIIEIVDPMIDLETPPDCCGMPA